MHQLRVNHHLHHHPVGSKKSKKIRNVLLFIIFASEQHPFTPTRQTKANLVHWFQKFRDHIKKINPNLLDWVEKKFKSRAA